MSDDRIREAERKWKESGSVDDEARYLLERVRVGDLTRERLELAAYCGHEGARHAVGGDAPPGDMLEWARGLARWPMAGERAAMEAVHMALSCVSTQRHGFEAPWEAVEAAKVWLACPCPSHEEAVTEAARRNAGGFTPSPTRNAKLAALYLGPSSGKHVDGAYPHFWAAICHAALAVENDKELRGVLERALVTASIGPTSSPRGPLAP